MRLYALIPHRPTNVNPNAEHPLEGFIYASRLSTGMLDGHGVTELSSFVKFSSTLLRRAENFWLVWLDYQTKGLSQHVLSAFQAIGSHESVFQNMFCIRRRKAEAYMLHQLLVRAFEFQSIFRYILYSNRSALGKFWENNRALNYENGFYNRKKIHWVLCTAHAYLVADDFTITPTIFDPQFWKIAELRLCI